MADVEHAIGPAEYDVVEMDTSTQEYPGIGVRQFNGRSARVDIGVEVITGFQAVVFFKTNCGSLGDGDIGVAQVQVSFRTGIIDYPPAQEHRLVVGIESAVMYQKYVCPKRAEQGEITSPVDMDGIEGLPVKLDGFRFGTVHIQAFRHLNGHIRREQNGAITIQPVEVKKRIGQVVLPGDVPTIISIKFTPLYYLPGAGEGVDVENDVIPEGRHAFTTRAAAAQRPVSLIAPVAGSADPVKGAVTQFVDHPAGIVALVDAVLGGEHSGAYTVEVSQGQILQIRMVVQYIEIGGKALCIRANGDQLVAICRGYYCANGLCGKYLQKVRIAWGEDQRIHGEIIIEIAAVIKDQGIDGAIDARAEII